MSAILGDKGNQVESASPRDTVLDAVMRMNRARIGSLVVIDAGRPVGIFTERDVLTRVIAGRLDPSATPVGEVMTREVIAIGPATTVGEAMVLVTDRRLRHLPVVDGGKLVGMVSIGDLTRWLVRDQKRQIEDLTMYIQRG